MSDDGKNPLPDVYDQLTEMGVDVTLPPEERIIYRDNDPSDTGSQYVPATNTLVVDREQNTVNIGYELLRYNEAVHGIGRPRPDYKQSVDALRQTVKEADDSLGDDTLHELFPRGTVLNEDETKIAGVMYASDTPVSEAYDTIKEDENAKKFFDELNQEDKAYQERIQAVLSPINRRLQEVEQLNLQTPVSATGLFWTVWATTESDQEMEDAFLNLLETGQFENMDQNDEDVVAALTSRLEQYEKHREEGKDNEYAAAKTINQGLNQHEDQGRELGLRGSERDYIASVDPDDYSGFETGEKLIETLEKGNAFREALNDVNTSFKTFESAYRSLHRNYTKQELDDDDLSDRIEEVQRDLEIAEKKLHESIQQVEDIAGLPGEDAFVDAVETLLSSYVAVLDAREHRRDDLDTEYLHTDEGNWLLTQLRTAGDDDLSSRPITNPVSAYLTEDLSEDDGRFVYHLGEEGAMNHLSRLLGGEDPRDILGDKDVDEIEAERVQVNRKIEESDLPAQYVKWRHENRQEEPDSRMFQ